MHGNLISNLITIVAHVCVDCTFYVEIFNISQTVSEYWLLIFDTLKLCFDIGLFTNMSCQQEAVTATFFHIRFRNINGTFNIKFQNGIVPNQVKTAE